MALTEEEKQSLKTDILNAIKSESSDVGQLEEVTSLDGITSLPAVQGNKLVTAPLTLLSKPATDAAKTANAAATTANNAAKTANTAATNATEAKNAANSAAATANEAAGKANQAATLYETTAKAALKGATARFSRIVESGTINAISASNVTEVVYVRNVKRFAGVYTDGKYCNNWAGGNNGLPGADMFLDDTRSNILKDKVYLCADKLFVWSDEENDLVEASGSGSGSGFYNVTNEQPLENGYYDKDTAIAALANADIDDENKRGMILTFEKSAGVWVDYRFIGTDASTFLTPASWEEYGGGKIKSISLNGQNIEPDVNGNVALTFDQIRVDESLDAESTNPVQNAAVTAKMNELSSGTVGGVEVIEGEDKNTLNILSTTGSVIASTEFSGGGGGGGTSTASRIIITASVDNMQVKEGGNATLTYSYNHVNADGESDGIKANITVTISRGTTQTFQQTYNNVSAGTFTLDISDYLLAGTVDIYVKAVATTVEGTVQTKQAYASVSVVTLTLTSSYNLGSTIANGGYKNSDTIEIPFTIVGSGTKDVSMYIDGSDTPTTQTINKSGTINGSFTIQGSSLTAGRHTVQLVAERNGLLSDSIYIDILKAGLSMPFIGIKYTDKSGTILHSDHLTPTLKAGQYEQMEFEYVAYDPNTTPASVQELQNGAAVRTLSVPRSMQTYTNRFTTQGTIQMQFVCRTTKYNFKVNVTESDVAVGEATQGLVLRLQAAGRSNDEENPASWNYGDVTTVFENVDWKSSGWTGEALRLMNGAKAVINYQPFVSDAARDGCTIEMEFTISNVSDRNADVITCLDGTKGFQITAEEASMYTGSTKNVEDDEGETVTTNVGVGSKFASDMQLKVAFVIGKRTDGRLIELYVNGIRSKADIYSEGDDFQQSNPKGITIDSTYANIDLRSVRVYNRAITDDEELGNYIVDRPTSTEMSNLFLSNDVLNEDGTDIDIDKLRDKGKGVMLFVRTGGLDPVNAENNKSTDFLSDVYFYSPFGKEYDFTLKNCYIRIQGTSSTKYPRKNYRIYFAKGSNPELYINGVLQEDGKNKYTMRPGAIPMNLFCMKCDYSDSSMTHNTGGAKLYNDLMKELGLLTPAQQVDASIRASIDGFPIDVFAAETIDEVPEYYGQYNFNNEKSKSGPLFGMEGVEDSDGSEVEWDCPITFEFLNNTQKLCLFQVDNDFDTQAENEFDDALEFNYPEDTYWSSAKASSEGGSVATSTQKTAVKRLFEWIRECIPAGADTTYYKDISSFASTKFNSEISNYFDVSHLLTYYLFTDYFACVDQRAKNMLLRTWDGLKWYITYYDGDTMLLGRNDSFLAYLYTVNRETWDSEKSKYAFEGHDSWLWCLVLANLESELKQCAASLREKLTNDRALEMFNVEQMGNWSERQYNKSGEFKYIVPQIEGVYVQGNLTKYPYIYALQGSREAHRTHTINNRFALLDARYETGGFRSDNIDMYMTRTAGEAANTIVVTSSEDYYFGYGTNNTPTMQASQEAGEDETVTLTFKSAFTVNDPIRIYGASRMKELDMKGAANNITGDLNLNKCTVLQKLDISTTGNGSSGWCIVLDKCTQLREVNLNGQTNARTGTLSSTELNFANQTRLERLDAGSVEVQGIVLAEGAPITYLRIPGTIKTLRLEYLPVLTSSGLIVESYASVETFRFSNCPNLDWVTLLAKCGNVKRIRVTDIDMEGDGSILAQYLSKGGIDEDGNATDTCALVGTYRLTKYLDDDVYNSYVEHYPELNIVQPDYTTIMFDDSISDSANISNLDNSTGYEYSNTYKPSGHINKILDKRHRVLGKKTATGTVTVCQLHDKNSNYYADADDFNNASPAILTGDEGNVFMYEPHYWYKGVNDFLNKKKYSFFSSNENCPETAESVKVTFEELQVKRGYAIRSTVDYDTIEEAEANVSTDSYCTVNVQGYKQVRYPSMTSALYGAVFVDASGQIIKRMKATSDSGMIDGMYCFTDIPENAVSLAFTISQAAPFDYVLLTKSDKAEAIEPDWVEHEECLIGVYEAQLKDDFLFSVSGIVSTASVSKADFSVYAANKGTGFQLVDYEMHKDVGNLFFAKYGERDSQGTCGPGTHTNGRSNGASNETGMQDTKATAKDGDPAPTISGDYYPNANAYVLKNEYDEQRTAINTPVCMGYENWYGNKAEWMDKVDFNKEKDDYIWRIIMPDGTERQVQGPKATGDLYPKCVIHGRYMDTIVAQSGGSVSTYYFDRCYQSGSTARVVFRSVDGANASGGVSYAYAYADSAGVYAYVGSRLAFRGTIKWASSVSAYKAISEIV